MTTNDLLLAQAARYPQLQCLDLIKALYQAEWGCGHLIANEQGALAYLQREWDAVPADSSIPLTEPLGDGFVRLHIASAKAAGLHPDTLFRLFLRASRVQSGNAEHFSAALDCIQSMADAGRLPISSANAASTLAGYRAAGCPATHHSEGFRAAYAPAYRVVDAENARLLPLLLRIDQLMAEKGRALVAIDGPAASGKTTLGAALGEICGAPVIPMDDFFLQPHQRTPERFVQVGGNVDHERFLAEVLEPLSRRETAVYRPFDCQQWALGDEVAVPCAPLMIVEGSYSLHPLLAEHYDLRILTKVDAAAQRERILRRNGERMLQRFLSEWIPMEERYFSETGIASRVDVIFSDS